MNRMFSLTDRIVVEQLQIFSSCANVRKLRAWLMRHRERVRVKGLPQQLACFQHFTAATAGHCAESIEGLRTCLFVTGAIR